MRGNKKRFFFIFSDFTDSRSFTEVVGSTLLLVNCKLGNKGREISCFIFFQLLNWLLENILLAESPLPLIHLLVTARL